MASSVRDFTYCCIKSASYNYYPPQPVELAILMSNFANLPATYNFKLMNFRHSHDVGRHSLT